MNPNTNDDGERRDWLRGHVLAVEGGTVTLAKSHQSGDNVGHHVEVLPDSMDEAVGAEVRPTQTGDVCIPTEGSRVLLAYRVNGRPVILGSRYAKEDTIPEFEPGERRIGHPTTNSHITLENDGTIQIEGDGGNTVTLNPDGSVVVNGGSTAPVTNVSTTKDGDGHITSISLVRADNVYVPSQ